MAFGPKACNDKKKKVFAYQSVGFRSQKKTNGVIPLGAGRQPRPSCDATIPNEFVFGNHIFSFVKRMNTTISSVHCRCATMTLLKRLGELEPKDIVIPKNVAIGGRAKQTDLTHAHHRWGLEVEPQAAWQLSFFV